MDHPGVASQRAFRARHAQAALRYANRLQGLPMPALNCQLFGACRMVIATRALTLLMKEAEDRNSLVCAGATGAARVVVSVRNRRKARERGMRGVSHSGQAIFLALQSIGAALFTSAYHKAGRLYLETPGRGYGFPVPASLRDLLVGDDTKYL